MSLMKFKNRPLSNLLPPGFFDMDDFFENRLWRPGLLTEGFWNGKSSEPALNIIETDDDFKIEMAAPGFAKKDFIVNVDNGVLNISAEKTESKKESKKNYTRREFNYNAFERSLKLPESVLEEKIKAVYKDGILSFKLAKKEEVKKHKPKMIEVT